MSSNYSKEVLDYLNKNIDADPIKIILKKSPFNNIDIKELAAQIKGRQIAKKKFPFLMGFEQYKYPVSISLEQSSSELTARYKANMYGGENVVDLTGGMGIDSYFLSKKFEHLDYIENNEELCNLTMHNFDILRVSNAKIHNTTAEKFLDQSLSSYNLVYIDPSRRVSGNKKTSIRNLLPNVVTLQKQLINLGDELLIKLSPMQDVTEALNLLDHVKRIEVVALNNEVKELLFILDKSYDGAPNIKAVNIDKNGISRIFQSAIENTRFQIQTSNVQKYVYQPHPSLIKAGLHDFNAAKLELKKLHNNSQLYTSSSLETGYFGRIFAIVAQPQFKIKEVLKHIDNRRANIICKNYPLTPTEIKKKLGIKDGGNKYIVATTLYNDKRGILVCERLF